MSIGSDIRLDGKFTKSSGLNLTWRYLPDPNLIAGVCHQNRFNFKIEKREDNELCFPWLAKWALYYH